MSRARRSARKFNNPGRGCHNDCAYPACYRHGYRPDRCSSWHQPAGTCNSDHRRPAQGRRSRHRQHHWFQYFQPAGCTGYCGCHPAYNPYTHHPCTGFPGNVPDHRCTLPDGLGFSRPRPHRQTIGQCAVAYVYRLYLHGMDEFHQDSGELAHLKFFKNPSIFRSIAGIQLARIIHQRSGVCGVAGECEVRCSTKPDRTNCN